MGGSKGGYAMKLKNIVSVLMMTTMLTLTAVATVYGINNFGPF